MKIDLNEFLYVVLRLFALYTVFANMFVLGYIKDYLLTRYHIQIKIYLSFIDVWNLLEYGIQGTQFK